MNSDQTSIDDIISGVQSGKSDERVSNAPKLNKERLSPNKIIDRLDDVTLQSEVEASKVVDIIDESATRSADVSNILKELKELVKSGADDQKKLELIEKANGISNEMQDKLFDAMNLLQYQDVLRQKIEKIASALSEFYEYLGEFLGKGIKKAEERTVGKHVEEARLEQDQQLDEVERIKKEHGKI